jgi:serine/threonine protein kinase
VDENERQRLLITELLEKRGSIAGRFSNIRRIDGGSTGHFSALVAAADSETKCDVALKFLLPNFSGGYRDDSFDREAELLEDFRGQPDIIQLVAPRANFTEVFTNDLGLKFPVQFSYYALELARTDVGTIIANVEWNAERLLVAYRAMCRAVQRLHKSGVAHRDLKPPNFLVMPDSSIRLSDLGTARRLTSSAALLGSYKGPPGDISYSAPEMLALLHDEHPTIAFRSDFFSLGAILFEMFSGVSLGSRIYDSRFVTDLTQAMLHVKRGQRRQVFDQFVTAIADARRIPSVDTFGAPVPSCLKDPLNDLVRALASLDYRKRLVDFSSVFNKLNVCLLILRNEASYQRWLEQKRRRRESIKALVAGGKS